MKDPMDTPEQFNDPELLPFYQWLNRSRVQPPANLLARVRAQLQKPSASLDESIDQLLQQDPHLNDPQMVWKVRAALANEPMTDKPSPVWYRWLSPLAAAATLTLAFVSFQSSGPRSADTDVSLPLQASAESSLPDLDSEMTQIIALASNLEGMSDLSKLESVENLAFLFD